MATDDALKEQVHAVVEALPEEQVKELITFLDYLQYKRGRHPSEPTPYKPIALGGLWAGVTIDEEDIAEVRREMWGGFGELEL